MKYDYDVAVIGGGAGGLFAASVANTLGAKTCIIDKTRLGGDCTWFGCMPSKAILKSASVAQLFKRHIHFGLTLKGNFSLDTSNVMSHVRDVVHEISTHHQNEIFEKRGIKIIIGSPHFISSNSLEVNDQKIKFKKCIICTGSHPVVLPIDGLKDIEYLTNETIFTLNELPKSLIVLGGGPIGIELSQAMHRLGTEVYVVEMMDTILFREDKDTAAVLENQLKGEGLKILTGKKAVRFKKENGNVVATLEDKQGGREEISAEQVLVAIGRAPNIEGLDLEKAGAKFSKKGIQANGYLQTTNKNIFACGDIVGPHKIQKYFMGLIPYNPSDYVGPGYYTPGSIDFGFVDCSNPSTKDPKCKNMQKFGFNVFEECMNGVDDDENGLADCYDPVCVFTPKCAELLGKTAFAFEAVAGDKTAPTVMFSKVDKLSDGAFMKIDTNEPSNLSVRFYHNDSTCTVLNKTLNDVGIYEYQNYSNFKPFHAVDLINESYSLGYALSNGTAYYYKVRVCDPSGNCGVSACANFTTRASLIDKKFIFKMDLPPGYTVDIPALNKTGYNFSETFTINDVPTTFDVGIKTNTSVTKNMNFTVHSNCGSGLSIGFYGVNVFEPMLIDMSNAFVCDEDTNMMGMNSSLKKWNTLIDKMYLGGAKDYIQMNVPVAYSASNTFNYVDDVGANAKDVDDYVNCESGGTSATACQVPVSLGF